MSEIATDAEYQAYVQSYEKWLAYPTPEEIREVFAKHGACCPNQKSVACIQTAMLSVQYALLENLHLAGILSIQPEKTS